MMASSARSRRPGFSVVLGGCAVLLTLGIALALLAQPVALRALGVAAIVGAWILPVLYAVQFRARARFRKTASGEEVQRAQRAVLAAVKQTREQGSLADNRQDRTLKRLEGSVRRLHVTAGEGEAPALRPDLDVLFVTSNGAGLGHVSRLLAIAEHLPEGRSFELLTLSAAYRQVAAPGLTVHYFPSSDATGESPARWNRLFAARLRELITSRRPRVVVFDGTWVYSGLTEVCGAYAVPLVWVQRGLWKAEVDEASHQRHAAETVVDEVIIPGDYAGKEIVDCGAGIAPTYVGPIVRTSRSDLLEREEACRALGLDPGTRHVLLNLGSGVLGDGEPLRETAIRVLGEQMPQAQIVQVVSPLAAPPAADGAVRSVQIYPVMPYARAFDLVIAAAGYNAAQEAVSLQVPTVLVPNLRTRTDDQGLRAQRLAEQGLVLTASDPQQLEQALISLAGEQSRTVLRDALATVEEARGGAEAAETLEHLVEARSWVDRAETLHG